MTNKHAATKDHHLDNHACSVNCLSWGAIFSGALVAVGLSFLLNLFGIATGLSVYTTSKSGIQTLAIGGFFGMAIGIMVVMFFSGWVSGYLGRAHCTTRHFGALYGLTTWCLALVLSAVLVTHLGDFVNKQHQNLISANEATLKMKSNIITFKGTAETVAHINAKADAPQSSKRQETEQTANAIGKSLFLTFLLFFVGALTCSYGGYVGMKKKNPF